MDKRKLITDLQSQGLIIDRDVGSSSRKGGAGPTDRKAVIIDGTTIMIPIHNNVAVKSPYTVETYHGTSLRKNDRLIGTIQFPPQPKFYNLKTAEGISYSQIALLHSHNVLATTVLQTCIRYSNRNTACQFYAIEQSLKAGKTIPQKTPQQLAEVAEAAVKLDGVEQLVMTTGTPNTTDRGAAYLIECAKAVKARVNLPIQAQCEPPDRVVWFERMKDAGIDTL